mmetsp:Transcript_5186/g.16571  ORF Transcript_5186/g.16571 Transcript_5186/m.16571 type:complete len:224 (+) Transcript_5186:1218-1889(+)
MRSSTKDWMRSVGVKHNLLLSKCSKFFALLLGLSKELGSTLVWSVTVLELHILRGAAVNHQNALRFASQLYHPFAVKVVVWWCVTKNKIIRLHITKSKSFLMSICNQLEECPCSCPQLLTWMEAIRSNVARAKLCNHICSACASVLHSQTDCLPSRTKMDSKHATLHLASVQNLWAEPELDSRKRVSLIAHGEIGVEMSISEQRLLTRGVFVCGKRKLDCNQL